MDALIYKYRYLRDCSEKSLKVSNFRRWFLLKFMVLNIQSMKSLLGICFACSLYVYLVLFIFCLMCFFYSHGSQERGRIAIHKAAITTTWFKRCRDIAVRNFFMEIWLLFEIACCNRKAEKIVPKNIFLDHNSMKKPSQNDDQRNWGESSNVCFTIKYRLFAAILLQHTIFNI